MSRYQIIIDLIDSFELDPLENTLENIQNTKIYQPPSNHLEHLSNHPEHSRPGNHTEQPSTIQAT